MRLSRIARALVAGLIAGCVGGVLPLSCQAGAARPKTVVILPFVIQGQMPASRDGGANPSLAVCPAGEAVDLKPIPAEDQTGVVTVVASSLQTSLTKQGWAAQVGIPGAAVQNGALVVTGCFTTVDEGSATKRIVGAGMGASTLAARVQIAQMTDGRQVVLATFPMESKGRNFGVGSGMLINAMRAKRTSLQGDAANLSDKIAKEFAKRTKDLR